MNKWQLKIQFDGINYEEVFDFEPFKITTKLEGKELTKSVSKIVIYDNLKEGREDALRLWLLRNSTSVINGQIFQNNVLTYSAEISLANSEYDRYEKTCDLQLLDQDDDYVQLLKTNDTDIDLFFPSTGGVWTFKDNFLQERYWGFNDDELLLDYNFGLESPMPFPPFWDNATQYYQAVSIGISGLSFANIYKETTIVRFSGEIFVAKRDNIGVSPVPSTSTDDWLFVTGTIYSWVRLSTFVERVMIIDTGAPSLLKVQPDQQFMSINDDLAVTNNFLFSRIIWTVPYYQDFLGQFATYDIGGSKIEDILEAIVTACFPGVLVTDQSPNFYAPRFQDLYPILMRVGMFKLSTIKNATPITATQQYTMKASKIFDLLKLIWNLDWIVNDNGYLQLVHPSETLTFDAIIDISNTTKSKKTYKNKPKNIAKGERWNFQSSDDDRPHFSEIKYKSVGDNIDYDLSDFNNYVLWAVGNPAALDDGYAMVITDPFGDVGDVGSLYNNNEDMFPGQILTDYMLNERMQKQGFIDGSPVTLSNNRQIELGKVKGEIGQLNSITSQTGIKTFFTDDLQDTAFIDQIDISTDEDLAEITIVL